MIVLNALMSGLFTMNIDDFTSMHEEEILKKKICSLLFEI